ncbi:uncharacterized protein G2W53_025757 [Senna tora]|uniref:Uncharacterized protein n=1 Tax=Senna tora TaxID=362788 RepID=A0A834TDS9_9FABA|nr:uncharacterized protein G2W53_025757 [Senna tora]
MHCTLQEISTESPKVSKPRKDSLSRKQQQPKNFTSSLKDCEESSLSRTNSDSRCSILAFLTFEPDGNWRIVALPVWCLNHINLASGVIMDGLQLVFPTPLNRAKIDHHKRLRGSLSDYVYPVKSFMGRSIAGSNVHRRCQNKIANRVSKLNEISGNSCSHQLICSNSSGLFPDSSAVVNSSDMFMSNSKDDKSVKKNPRKRAKKKGRQSKKQSSDSGSTEAEVLPEVYSPVSLTSEICGSNHVGDEDLLLSYTTGTKFSSSDRRLIKNDSERTEVDDRTNLTEALKSCTPYTDEMEMSEATTPIIQKSAGESAICNSQNQLQNKGPDIAVIFGETRDGQQIQACCYNEVHPKSLSNLKDSPVLDSVSGASNSDESTNDGTAGKQSDNANSRIGCSEPPSSISGDESTFNQSLLNSVGNDNDHTEGIRHSAPNCGSTTKRVKQKRTSQSSSVNKFGGIGNFHGRTGKENSHSVWQKVQKNTSDECNGDSKKVNPTLSQFDSTLKSPPSVNRNCKFVGANSLSKTEERKLLKNNASRKSKGKMDSDSKKGYCSYSKKGSHFNRSILNNSAKISVQLNDMSHISSQENSQEVFSSISGSHSSVCSAQVHLEDSELSKDVQHSISTVNNQNTEKQDGSLSMPCDHKNQSSVSEEQSPIHYHLSGHEVVQTDKEVSSVDYNVQNNSSGSILWKWIPIGKKDTGLAISGSDSSSQEYSEEPPQKDSTLESNAEPEVVSFSQSNVSLLAESETCMDQISSNFSCLDENENKSLGNQVAYTRTEQKDKHVVPSNLIHKCEYQDALDNYSCRIAQAANDACRVQQACESVHMATGGPIAEFEILLHKFSPFICQSSNSLGCLTCPQDHANGVSLCRHETPDLSLGSVWQWYEKHGSYGLEVRAQEYISKRLDAGYFPFRAYFVPSLSAVQLFKDHKCIHSSDNLHDYNISEACETSNMPEHSSASQHPIFSVLFPQPRNQNVSIPTPKSQMLHSEVSTSAKDYLSDPSINSECSGDLELLFEYFESEQPQQRQPLYEKVQELVSGNVPSQSQVFGDPAILDSVNFQDLHPRSWYSVAWYPIYRIPDGNFRAAFLTYHSLGHLAHRSIKSGSGVVDSCIVSPVVGLQSYNAQGECWFQPGQSAKTAEMLGLDPSILHKERLRTLEETASLMARATVNKGNLVCTNRQPDYEFFLSRRRW